MRLDPFESPVAYDAFEKLCSSLHHRLIGSKGKGSTLAFTSATIARDRKLYAEIARRTALALNEPLRIIGFDSAYADEMEPYITLMRFALGSIGNDRRFRKSSTEFLAEIEERGTARTPAKE